MVIVKLLGGLGNQMFQYACGRNIALNNNSDLKLDLSFYENDDERKYSLGHFSVVEKKAIPEEIKKIKQKDISKLNRLKQKLFNTFPYAIHENDNVLMPGLKIDHDLYIDGYWQSEKYFADSALQIKKDFQIKTPPSSENQSVLSKIDACEAVSLHIRRGDFLKDKQFNNIHGTCTIDYYHKAAGLIADKVAKPVFYVFSDDISWAKQNLQLSYSTHFVDINDDAAAFEDLRLMQHCKHNILANSTFSWWGAWLNANLNKTIIAPKKWFNDFDLNARSGSLIPADWIRV